METCGYLYGNDMNGNPHVLMPCCSGWPGRIYDIWRFMGISKARWMVFVNGKIPSFEMDDEMWVPLWRNGNPHILTFFYQRYGLPGLHWTHDKFASIMGISWDYLWKDKGWKGWSMEFHRASVGFLRSLTRGLGGPRIVNGFFPPVEYMEYPLL